MTIKNAKYREEKILIVSKNRHFSERRSIGPRHYFAVRRGDRKILDEGLIT